MEWKRVWLGLLGVAVAPSAGEHAEWKATASISDRACEIGGS